MTFTGMATIRNDTRVIQKIWREGSGPSRQHSRAVPGVGLTQGSLLAVFKGPYGVPQVDGKDLTPCTLSLSGPAPPNSFNNFSLGTSQQCRGLFLALCQKLLLAVLEVHMGSTQRSDV